jgi:hypothetical protein
MLKLGTALSLAFAARKRPDVAHGIARSLVGFAAPWMTSTLLLHTARRDVEADPQSLGVLFEDRQYMWWWIRTTATLPVYTCVYVRNRGAAHGDMGPVLVTGDPAFDARFVASRHPTMPDCDDCARSLLASAPVRRMVGDLISDASDDCTLGSHISLTRRRTSGSFDDVIIHMDGVAALADAEEAVFRSSPYR